MNTTNHFQYALKSALLLLVIAIPMTLSAQKKNAEKATRYYQEAVQYEQLDEAYLSLQKVNSAIPLFPDADRLAKARAYVLRSRLYESQGKTDDALESLKIAANTAPKELEILQALAEFQLRNEMYEDGEATCTDMLQVMPMYTEAEIILGRIEMARGQRDKALARFDKIINRFADLGKPYLFRADVFLAMDKPSEAVDDLMMALSLKDESRSACLDMIERMAETPAADQLESSLKKRVEMSRNNLPWMECLARFKQAKNELSEAIELYEKILETEKNASLASRLSSLFLDLRRWNSALEYASKAVEWAPDSFLYKSQKATVYWYQDDIDSFYRQEAACIELLPENTRFYASRGFTRELMGDNEGALKDFEEVLKRQPEHPDVLLRYGRIHYGEGFIYRAEQEFNQCFVLDSLNYTAGSTAPFALFYMDRRKEAEEFAKEILSRDGDAALLMAARFYSLMNETTTAMSYLKRADESFLLNYYCLMREPELYNLRTDPAFIDFIREREPAALALQPVEGEKPAEIVVVEPVEEPEVTVVEVPAPVAKPAKKTETVEEKNIPYKVVNGMMRVNGKIKGADQFFAYVPGSRFQISQAKAEDLLKKNLITRSQISGSVDAKGIISVGSTIFFSSIQLGPVTVHNVTAVVVKRDSVALQFGADIFDENMTADLDRAASVIHVTIRNKNK